jgi:hypothetical protein
MTLLLTLSPYLILAVLAGLALSAKRKLQRESRMTGGAHPLENLLPLAAYDADETGYWKRMHLRSGALFGVGLAAVELISPIPGTRYSPLICAVVTLVIGGPAFGLLFPPLLRIGVRRLVVGLYVGEPSIIDPPPPNQLVRYQLPCTWLRENWELEVSFTSGLRDCSSCLTNGIGNQAVLSR